ncbi:MAG: hypothetical protein JNN25_09000 [Candidatus Kapabacteria bacterium]|nr:hypothetical protein [Candidatus Kapabacteria bacterium]
MLHNTRTFKTHFYQAYGLLCFAAVICFAHVSLDAQTLNVYSKGKATTIKASDLRSVKFDKTMTIQSATSATVTSFELGAVDSITVTAAQTTTTYKGSISKGVADSTWVQAIVTSCTGMFTLGRSGRVKDASGVSWVVPMPVNAGRAIPDLYNPCTSNSTADTSNLETFVIDPDGVVITAYIHADNYFELYVNGTFVGRDRVPFTPFNSSIVRFKAKYPITYAFKCADWEEHLGVGMEYDTYNVGDAGIVAYFSDGTKTDETWKAQVFYIAPLDNPACVVENADGTRTSINCSSKPTCSSAKNPSGCYALHYPVPDGWELRTFDDSKWPAASVFTEARFGPKEAYTNYRGLFRDGKFIWTSNLDLDNFVILRKTVTK